MIDITLLARQIEPLLAHDGHGGVGVLVTPLRQVLDSHGHDVARLTVEQILRACAVDSAGHPYCDELALEELL